MERKYSCPHCVATLNPGVKIIMIVVSKDDRGLVLFDPQPGSYNTILPANFKLAQDDIVDFLCPVCQKSLTSETNEKLAEIAFEFDDGSSGRVLFSRVFGEEATYFVTREQVTQYGKNAGQYGSVNFFGAGRNDF